MARIKGKGGAIPTRGEIKDIARSTSHAPSSMDRYIRDFQRIKMLYVKGMALAEIAYITSLSENLVSEYIKIVKEQMLKK